MLKKSSFFLLLLSALISNDLSVAKTLVAQDEFCLGCHPAVAKSQHILLHIGCEKCHMISEGGGHPENGAGIKLVQDVPFLCFKCHPETAFRGKYVHPPVEMGWCETCHKLHRPYDQKLLKDESEVCFRCHGKEDFAKKYKHKVVAGSCGRRCHNPHVSDYPHLLSSDVNTLCIGCHKEQQSGTHIVAFAGGKLHPVSGVYNHDDLNVEMNCAICHNPHSSDYPNLFAFRTKCRTCHRF